MKMIKRMAVALTMLLSITVSAAQKPVEVVLETNKGNIVLELDPMRAPVTVKNFLAYVKEGYYNGLTFHRVINNFMIQGGGFTPEMKQKATKSPIKNESTSPVALRNNRGTIAMARTNAPDSATSQFFINHNDNAFLDSQNGQPGYAAFGKVVSGMNIVDSIAQVKTTNKAGHGDVPVTPVIIKKAYAK